MNHRPFRFPAAMLFVLLSWTMLFSPRTAHAGVYDRRIIAPADANATLSAALNDLQDALHQMTGQTFDVAAEVKDTGGGIFIVRAASAPSEVAAPLKDKGREPFVIRGDADRLWIVANRDEGLSHGIYFFLEQLGVRYLAPSPNWTIIPKRDDIALTIDQLVEPAFKGRSFFGTGGFGGDLPLDPKRSLQQRWMDWQRRNRFGGEYFLSGHSGEAFNIACKETLLAHPEYLAEIDGKRAEWSIGGKFDPSNPDAVKLYVDYILENFRRQRQQQPDSPYSYAASVDPSDGGGHCNCSKCQEMFGPAGKPEFRSNQVFHVANQAAKAIRAEFPDAYVNLYGYNEHAAVPSIELEPNILVMIIPYAFQRTGLSPEQFIAAWGKKLSRMSIYDYWSITDWAHCLPVFDYRHDSARKIRYWHEHNIEAFNGESTFSIGAMGPAWYVASRLLWDPSIDEQAIADEFVNLSFGPAKDPMRRMLDRWAGGYMPSRQELAMSFADIEQARQLAAADADVLNRVNDFATYVQYLRLWQEYQMAQRNAANAPDAVVKTRRPLLTFIWRIYDSAVVHTYREHVFLVGAGTANEVTAEFDVANFDAPGWKDVRVPPTEDEIQQIVAAGRRDYPPVEFDERSFSGELIPLNPQVRPTGKWSAWLSLGGETPIVFQAQPGMKRMSIRVRWEALSADPSQIEGLIVAARDSSGAEMQISKRILPAPDNNVCEISLPISKPGQYDMTVSAMPRGQQFSGYYDLAAPEGVPLVLNRFDTWRWGAGLSPIYFYVPNGAATAAIYLPASYLHGIRDGKHEPIQYKADDFLVLDVPPGQAGAVWSIDGCVTAGSSAPVRAVNIPQAFSFFPDTMMIPADAR